MGEYGWVAEWLQQFLKSPVWTTPVQSFIDEFCDSFEDCGEEEHKLEYTKIHKEFCDLVDRLLGDYLGDMGCPQEAFLEMMQEGTSELDSLVQEYLLALDDFKTFRKMMEKRFIELELETMQAMDYSDLGEEGFYEQAITESRRQVDLQQEIREKEIEAADAELQHALAISLAAEQDRQRAKEEEIQAKVSDRQEQQQRIEESRKESEQRKVQLQEDVLQARVDNLKSPPPEAKKPPPEEEKPPLAAEDKKPPPEEKPPLREEKPPPVDEKPPAAAAPADPPPAAAAPAPALATPAQKTSRSSGPIPTALDRRELESTGTPTQLDVTSSPSILSPAIPSAPAPTPVTGPADGPRKSVPHAMSAEKVATLDRVQIPSSLAFGAKAPLPALGGPIRQPLPGLGAAANPSFSALRKEVNSMQKPKAEEPKKDGPSDEEVKRRMEMMKEQRERLIAAKKAAREKELETYIKERTGEKEVNVAAASSGEDPSQQDASTIEMRKALARRMKEDLMH